MQIKIFTIPTNYEDRELEEMNHFLRANKIADVRKEFFGSVDGGYWTFCVTYLPDATMRNLPQTQNFGKKEKIDYKNVLDEASFERFTQMRTVRKQIAENEAIPPYAVFTDAELAEIAKFENPTLQDLAKVDGIGKRKLEKYGVAFCNTEMMTE